jgi:hypothetical protein
VDVPRACQLVYAEVYQVVILRFERSLI